MASSDETCLLQRAIEEGSHDCVRRLLDEGVDPAFLLDAFRAGCWEHMQYLFETSYGPHSDFYHLLLEDSCVQGNKAVLELLLKHRIDLKHGENAMVGVVRNNHRDILELLLESEIPRRMCRLIYVAVDKGFSEILEYLLEYEHPCFNVNSSFGNLALMHLAARRFNPATIEVLWKYGANIDIRDRNDNTPLHYACENSDGRIVQTLLRLGANINANNCQGKTPVDLLSVRDEDASRCLRQHIAAFRAAGLRVDEKCLSFEQCGGGHISTECDAEVEAMKRTSIPNTNTTFYKVLKCTTNEIANYAKNPHIIEGLKSDVYKETFPNYSSLLRSKIKVGLQRRAFIDEFKRNIVPTDRILNRLPWSFIKRSLSFLSNERLGQRIGHYCPREKIDPASLPEYEETFEKELISRNSHDRKLCLCDCKNHAH